MIKSKQHLESSRKAQQVLGWSIAVTGVGFILVVVGVVTWIELNGPGSLFALRADLDALKPWLAGWRALLFIILIGGWRRWTDYLAMWSGMNEAQKHGMLSARWRIAGWLIFLEIAIIQGLGAEFVRALVPGSA